jgi:chromosome segregation ATPase
VARMSTSYTQDDLDQDDEDERNANAQLMTDLKEQVQRAEQASEQYRKQLELMQQRLDETTNEQTAAEERDFQRQTELDKLRAEIKELARQRRELTMTHDSEKRMLLQDRERSSAKEAQLQATISRLNETLRNKGIERSNASRAGKYCQHMDEQQLMYRSEHTRRAGCRGAGSLHCSYASVARER